MNSLQKKSSLPKPESHETYVSSFEKQVGKSKLSEVELLMKQLQFLGKNFDPFQDEIGQECGQIVEKLGLTDHLKNPYLATNIILRLLDITEERLNNLKQ